MFLVLGYILVSIKNMVGRALVQLKKVLAPAAEFASELMCRFAAVQLVRERLFVLLQPKRVHHACVCALPILPTESATVPRWRKVQSPPLTRT
jgi:hypothetical protein